MKKFLAVALVASLALLTGCATTLASSNNGKLAYAQVTGAEKGNFAASERGFYVLGFIGLNKPQEKLDSVIEPQLAPLGANAVKNLKVVSHYDFLGYLVNTFTLSLIQVPNIEISGTAVAQ